MSNFILNWSSIWASILLGIISLAYFIKRSTSRIQNAVTALKYLKIEVISNSENCTKAVAELRSRCYLHHAVGFDCEWVTEKGHRQPVALVQLSTIDGYCGLFRLNKIKSVPRPLKELLEDPSIYKVGVAPVDDAKYLAQDYDVILKGTLDIRHIAEYCGHESGGLAALSKACLGVVLDKSWRVRCSDWEADELSERQIAYAAADAHVAIKIFVKLIDSFYNKSLLNLFKKDFGHWNDINNLCDVYVDTCFKTKKKNVANRSNNKKPIKEESKRYPHATRSKPLYHNCFLEAPDGELLCTCDNKKAIWYVEKELADKIKDDPLTVRLRFEPAGRSVGEVGRYYQLKKDNKCVVCGEPNSYIRKNVVPREYRKYFPEIIKDRVSHDVVLLCGLCHQRSNMRDQPVRERLARQCGAPIEVQGRTKYLEDADCKKIRSAARALLYQSAKHCLPRERRAALETVLLQHYPDHTEITHELLQEAANLQVTYANLDYESHGQKVVRQYLANNEILKLEEMWRKHFLNSMEPKYMPELWSVTHNEERLRVRLSEGRLSEEDIKLVGLL